MKTFKIVGYFKEYYIDKKFIGTLDCKKDSDVFGYYSKKKVTLDEDVILDNKKKLKKGQEVYTMLFPLNGGEI